MRLRRIAGDCHDGACPTVYLSESGSIVVQGYAVTRAEGLTLPDGEQAVEIPAELFDQAMKGLRQCD